MQPCMNAEHYYFRPMENGEPDTLVSYALNSRFMADKAAMKWKPWLNHYEKRNGAYWRIEQGEESGCIFADGAARQWAKRAADELIAAGYGKIALVVISATGDERADTRLLNTADAAERDASWLHTYAMVQTIMRDFPDYVPNTYLQYYLYPEQVVAQLDPDHTRTEEVRNGREKRVFTQCRQAARQGSTKGLTIAKSEVHADMIVEVASSIAFDKGELFIMITRNNGTVSNFHEDAMVETAAHVGANGVTAVPFGKIDVFMKGLMEGQYAYEHLTVDSYFEGSYKKALQALTLNRTLVDAQKAKAVLDDLIDANQGYWPELK